MKKVIFCLFFIIGFLTVEAQNNSNLIKLSIGVLNKIRLGYEHPINERFSVGGNINAYYGSFPGFKLEPFGRYYFSSKCPEALYIQARALFGSFNPNITYYSQGNFQSSLISGTIEQKKSFTSFGGGIDFGYQWLKGKNKNIVIDFSLGFQIMNSGTLQEDITVGGKVYGPANLSFVTTGPGGLFNPHLSFGFAF